MRESAPVKARRLLVEARVNLRVVDGEQVRAIVRGDSALCYETGFDGHRWFCTCDAASTLCSHVRAVQLVTIQPKSIPCQDLDHSCQ